jgi:hypothetical protein
LDRQLGLLEQEKRDVKRRFDELQRVFASKMVPLAEEEQATLDHFIGVVAKLVEGPPGGPRERVSLELVAGVPAEGRAFQARLASDWSFEGHVVYQAAVLTSNFTVEHLIRASFQEIADGPPPVGGQALKDSSAMRWIHDEHRTIRYTDLRRVRAEGAAAFEGAAIPLAGIPLAGIPLAVENEIIYEELN